MTRTAVGAADADGPGKWIAGVIISQIITSGARKAGFPVVPSQIIGAVGAAFIIKKFF